jgi:hypothetical protein
VKAKSRIDCHKYFLKNKEKIRAYHRKNNITPHRRKYMNEYRKQMRLKKDDGLILRARQRVYDAIDHGHLKRGPCQSCGFKGRTDGHHKDYSKPLDVIWLCDPCHRQVHAQMRHPKEHGNSLLSKLAL